PPAVRRRIEHVVLATRANTGLTLVMAFNYGGRDELIDACRALAREIEAGRLRPEGSDDARRWGGRYTQGGAAPPHLVRTEGERRDARLQLPPVADRLHGALDDADALARLRGP